ncbi:hypothetical protein [Anaerovibrio sp. RM50]|uniref:hypothetical protein n=1 Tax=Anaerovibrio sp. RM50 TaxID=1200557 RepID=UPI000485D1EB|nr:hypothetical protein [Anaerovibrio sp. RM50]
MKKNCGFSFIRLIIAIFMFGVVSINYSDCQAANWVWVTSTDEVTIEIDTTSVKKVNYTLAGTNAVCWYKFTNLDKTYSLHHMAFRVNNNNPESTIFETYVYDADGRSEGYAGHPEPYSHEYKSIIPDSVGEILFETVMDFFKK